MRVFRRLDDFEKAGLGLALIGIACVIAIVRAGMLLPDAHAQITSGSYFSWGFDNVGATLTQVIPATDGQTRLGITDIVIASTTATGGEFLLQYGTGSNCGTGTVSVLPSTASVVRLGYNANTSSATTFQFKTPLRVPSGKALCILCIATQTCSGQIIGEYAQQ